MSKERRRILLLGCAFWLTLAIGFIGCPVCPGDGDGDGDVDGDGDADGDVDGDADGDGDSDADSDSESDTDSDTNGDGDTDGEGDGDVDGESDGDTDEPVGECGDGILQEAAGEECDWENPLCVDCLWQPGNDGPCIAPRVVQIVYLNEEPRPTPGEDDARRDADQLAACFTRQMREASSFHGSGEPFVRYRIVETVVVRGETPKTDGSTEADYHQIMADHGLCERIGAGEIDEVWLWADGSGGFAEWLARGPNYDHQPHRLPDCGVQYFVMGWNITRDLGQAMHSFGHRAEYTLHHYFENVGDNLAMDHGGWWVRWDGQGYRYGIADDAQPPVDPADGPFSCGNVHFAPQADRAYSPGLGERTSVDSDCEDWQPDGSGGTSPVSCLNWGCCEGDPCDIERAHLSWWLQNLPHRGHVTGNWWRFLYAPGMPSCGGEEIPGGCTDLGSRGGSRYLLCPEASWAAARNTCRAIGDEWDLVGVDDEAENSWLTTTIDSAGTPRIWIGLSDRFDQGFFRWVRCQDEEATASFTFWDTLEPNHWTNEDCVELDYARRGSDGNPGHWNDLPCDFELAFVCEGTSE